jgi:pSer/pThr/pTyr-binding forkhead associated (FHA) protein
MQAILEIRAGPSAGKKVAVAPGKTLKVGRVAPADFLIRGDAMMSNVHFEVVCDDQGCQVRDLGSRFGTFVNKQKVTQTALKEGDQITAGNTTFVLRFGEETSMPATPTVVPAPVPPPVRVEAPPAPVARPPTPAPAAPAMTIHQRVLERLSAEPEPLFALLDAARDASVLVHLLGGKEEYQSLYEGPKGEQLAVVAPYLVCLPQQSPLLATLVKEGWGKSWGIYLTSPEPFKEVRKHFRRFLEVGLPDGKKVYFRYYDPRVLRVYLPTCTAEEWRQFAGSVSNFFVEGDKPEVLLHFAARRKSQPVPLTMTV